MLETLILFSMDLEGVTSLVCDKAHLFSERWAFSFDLMFRTGCRHEETDLSRWSIIDNQSFMLDCAKRSETRIIFRSELSLNLCSLIDQRLRSEVYVNRSVLTSAFMRLSFPYRIMAGSDNVFLHSFRYNKIKEMFSEGVAVVDIKTYIGHKDIKNTLGYISKQLNIVKL